jgi:hypothetical protein
VVSGSVRIKIHKTMIIPVALYGCETWSLTLWEEHRLRVFGNRVLREIFGPKREEVAGECREIHYQKIHNFILKQILLGYSKRDDVSGTCRTDGRHEKCVRNFRS